MDLLTSLPVTRGSKVLYLHVARTHVKLGERNYCKPLYAALLPRNDCEYNLHIFRAYYHVVFRSGEKVYTFIFLEFIL